MDYVQLEDDELKHTEAVDGALSRRVISCVYGEKAEQEHRLVPLRPLMHQQKQGKVVLGLEVRRLEDC